jgi:elongation factor Ts
MTITAKDVQSLRLTTGVGMMDAKRALEISNGDVQAATQWLRVQGLASAAKRTHRPASEGLVAIAAHTNAAAIVELRCETDFVAKSKEFVDLGNEIALRVASDGTQALALFKERIDTMLTTLKENISIGRVSRQELNPGEVFGTYIHYQAGRGTNAVIVVTTSTELAAHELAVHIAFAKPLYLHRSDVPSAEVAAERITIEEITRNEGRPEAALEKIIEGRLNGWYKDRVLLEQSFVKNEKETVTQFLNGATVTSYAQVVVGQ